MKTVFRIIYTAFSKKCGIGYDLAQIRRRLNKNSVTYPEVEVEIAASAELEFAGLRHSFKRPSRADCEPSASSTAGGERAEDG